MESEAEELVEDEDVSEDEEASELQSEYGPASATAVARRFERTAVGGVCSLFDLAFLEFPMVPLSLGGMISMRLKSASSPRDEPSKELSAFRFDMIWEGRAVVGSIFFTLTLKAVHTKTSARGTRCGYWSLNIRDNISVLQY